MVGDGHDGLSQVLMCRSRFKLRRCSNVNEIVVNKDPNSAMFSIFISVSIVVEMSLFFYSSACQEILGSCISYHSLGYGAEA